MSGSASAAAAAPAPQYNCTQCGQLCPHPFVFAPCAGNPATGIHNYQLVAPASVGIVTQSSKSDRDEDSGDSEEEAEREYRSFRKKVLRRHGIDPAHPPGELQCCLCSELVMTELIEAARILDRSQSEALYAQYFSDPANFPVSINNPENGLLACIECRTLFEHPARHISFDQTGLLHFSPAALRTEKFKKLHKKKAKVSFAAKIGKKDYPSAAFIEWAGKQSRTAAGSDERVGLQ